MPMDVTHDIACLRIATVFFLSRDLARCDRVAHTTESSESSHLKDDILRIFALCCTRIAILPRADIISSVHGQGWLVGRRLRR